MFPQRSCNSGRLSHTQAGANVFGGTLGNVSYLQHPITQTIADLLQNQSFAIDTLLLRYAYKCSR